MVEIVNEVEGEAEVGKETPKDISAENRLVLPSYKRGIFHYNLSFQSCCCSR